MEADGKGYGGEILGSRQLSGMVITASRYPSGEVLPDHFHASATLCLVVNGAFEERWEGEAWRRWASGAVLYRPSGSLHSDRFLHSNTTTLAIDLSPELSEAGPRRPRDLPSRKTAAVVRKLYAALDSQEVFSSLDMESLVLAMHEELARVPEDGQRRVPAWLQRTARRLSEPGMPVPSLSELARDANVHPMHLTRTFRRFYGCSIGDYARQERIEHCCRLLFRREIDLGQVAAEAGFCDQAHFTRVFRSVKGCTPGVFRRALRG